MAKTTMGGGRRNKPTHVVNHEEGREHAAETVRDAAVARRVLAVIALAVAPLFSRPFRVYIFFHQAKETADGRGTDRHVQRRSAGRQNPKDMEVWRGQQRHRVQVKQAKRNPKKGMVYIYFEVIGNYHAYMFVPKQTQTASPVHGVFLHSDEIDAAKQKIHGRHEKCIKPASTTVDERRKAQA